jgi:hypothetical protein
MAGALLRSAQRYITQRILTTLTCQFMQLIATELSAVNGSQFRAPKYCRAVWIQTDRSVACEPLSARHLDCRRRIRRRHRSQRSTHPPCTHRSLPGWLREDLCQSPGACLQRRGGRNRRSLASVRCGFRRWVRTVSALVSYRTVATQVCDRPSCRPQCSNMCSRCLGRIGCTAGARLI